MIESAWDNLEVWLRANAPAVLDTFRPPASKGDIEAAEDFLGRALPTEYRQSLGRHDGQIDLLHSPTLYSFGLLECGWALLPVAASLATSQMMGDLLGRGEFKLRDADGGDWWSLHWFPITDNGCGDNHCLDLRPPSDAQASVITFWHNWRRRPIVAPSFAAWLNSLVVELASGRVSFDPVRGFVRDQQDQAFPNTRPN